MRTRSTLCDKIPANHVMLLYWTKQPGDPRHIARGLGQRIIPAAGCIKAANDLDTHGERTDSERVEGGHGVTVLWPSGRRREVRS